MNQILALIAVINLLWMMRLGVQVSFYRSYFFQKQINLGKDPDDVLKKEFPWVWRLM